MQLDENFDLGDAAVATCESHGMIDGMFSTEALDAADLIRVRKLAYPALERLGATLLDDVALPITKIAEFVGLVEELAAKHQLTIGIFGHAGDGNMHPTIVHDHGDLEGEKRARLAFSEIVKIAQSKVFLMSIIFSVLNSVSRNCSVRLLLLSVLFWYRV
jgi:glycolate oxidase